MKDSETMTDVDESVRRRTAAVSEYRKKLLQHKELESRVRTGSIPLSIFPDSTIASMVLVPHLYLVRMLESRAPFFSVDFVKLSCFCVRSDSRVFECSLEILHFLVPISEEDLKFLFFSL